MPPVLEPFIIDRLLLPIIEFPRSPIIPPLVLPMLIIMLIIDPMPWVIIVVHDDFIPAVIVALIPWLIMLVHAEFMLALIIEPRALPIIEPVPWPIIPPPIIPVPLASTEAALELASDTVEENECAISVARTAPRMQPPSATASRVLGNGACASDTQARLATMDDSSAVESMKNVSEIPAHEKRIDPAHGPCRGRVLHIQSPGRWSRRGS